MACSTIVQACLASRRQLPAYSPPEPLEHLHVLDLLELTGSQSKAAQALPMHQSTVCRSAALMGEQFRLQPRPGASVLRYGTNESLQLLRLSYRAHRMMDGQLRIATDPLHQPLLAGMLSVQSVPPKFRHSGEWAQLLSQALIDGAIVSSWCHHRRVSAPRPPTWTGVMTVPLGALPLQLFIPTTSSAEDLLPRKVLLPRRPAMPLLHEALAWHGFQLEEQPLSCHDLPAWLKRMRDRQLALPLCPGMLEPGWIETQGLMLHPEQAPLLEQLWLLVPEGRVRSSREARHLIRTLRLRLAKVGEELLGEAEALMDSDE
ncbi:hypothetical protein NZK33_07255 [Cyanobium sp. FGCU-6]|nr:hypothetical protein [Cyanobium sp. FGCU6]